MTRNYYRTGNYKPDHSTCGSKIYNYDYEGYNSMSNIAERIISDWKFDKMCKTNIQNRKNNKIKGE